jgi:hypothetical protein
MDVKIILIVQVKVGRRGVPNENNYQDICDTGEIQ